jgi:hypothetical protein
MAPYKDPYPDVAAMRRRYALQLLEEANKNSPVQHPLQALARALQGGLGGCYARQLAREEFEKNNAVGSLADATASQADQAWNAANTTAASSAVPSDLPYDSQLAMAPMLAAFPGGLRMPELESDAETLLENGPDDAEFIPVAPKQVRPHRPDLESGEWPPGPHTSFKRRPPPDGPITDYETYRPTQRNTGRF